jgi:hypothetical protein
MITASYGTRPLTPAPSTHRAHAHIESARDPDRAHQLSAFTPSSAAVLLRALQAGNDPVAAHVLLQHAAVCGRHARDGVRETGQRFRAGARAGKRQRGDHARAYTECLPPRSLTVTDPAIDGISGAAHSPQRHSAAAPTPTQSAKRERPMMGTLAGSNEIRATAKGRGATASAVARSDARTETFTHQAILYADSIVESRETVTRRPTAHAVRALDPGPTARCTRAGTTPRRALAAPALPAVSAAAAGSHRAARQR